MEERKKVLELIASGQLTIDEGDRLLAALDVADRPPPPPPPPESSAIEDAIARAIEASYSAVPAPRFAFRMPKIKMGRGPHMSGLRSIDDIVSFASVGVSPTFVREMREIFEDEAEAGELVSLQSVGVTPEYAREMREIFDDEVQPGEVISLHSVGVTPDYAREMREIFDDEAGAGEVISLHSLGVPSDYARQMRRLFDDSLEVGELMSLHSLGVDAAYVRAVEGDEPDARDVIRKKTTDDAGE